MEGDCAPGGTDSERVVALGSEQGGGGGTMTIQSEWVDLAALKKVSE